jgi:hypothetical protein
MYSFNSTSDHLSSLYSDFGNAAMSNKEGSLPSHPSHFPRLYFLQHLFPILCQNCLL